MLKVKDEKFYTWYLEIKYVDPTSKQLVSDATRLMAKAATPIDALRVVLDRLAQRDATVVTATLSSASA